MAVVIVVAVGALTAPGGHPAAEAVPAPAAAAASVAVSERIAVVKSGVARVKQHSWDAAWTDVWPPNPFDRSTYAYRMSVTGDRIAVVAGQPLDGYGCGAVQSGTSGLPCLAWVKEGPDLNAPWQLLDGNANRVLLAGDRIAVLRRDFTLWVKEGPISAPWVFQDDHVIDFAMTETRIGIVRDPQAPCDACLPNPTAYVKEGALTAGWVELQRNVKQIALSGNRVGVLHLDNTAYVKEGSISAPWVFQDDHIKSIGLGGGRIGLVKDVNCPPGGFCDFVGTLYVSEGAITARNWVLQDNQVASFLLAGNRIAATGGHGGRIKTGNLFAGWAYMDNGTIFSISMGAESTTWRYS